MSRLVKLAPALAALTFALTASAGGLDVKGSPSVKFHATGTGGLRIDGEGKDLKISEDGGKLVFKTSLKGLKTGIGLRDGHCQKYLDTANWPDASLTVAKDKVKFPKDGKVSSSATGEFRLHGVTKSKKFDYTAEKDGGGYKVTAKFDVDILEHKIEQPCYLGVCMNKDVKVEVEFKAKD